MLTIGNLNIPLYDLEQMTFLETGKDIKSALLHYYRSNSKIHDFLDANIDDTKEFKIIVASKDELTRVLNFESVNLIGLQSIKLRTYNVSTEDIYDAVSLFEGDEFLECLYLPLDNNIEFISWEDFKNFTKVLKEFKKAIPLNLSPLEKVILAYDYAKAKTYQNDPDDPYTLESRRLSSAMLDGYIVCAGFTKLFNALLKEMNVPCTEYRFKFKEKEIEQGHDISLVNVRDKKYQVYGLYFFDVTADSYQEKDREDNKLKYSYFLRTFDDYKNIDITIDSFNLLLNENEEKLRKMITGMEKSALAHHSDIFENDNFEKLVKKLADLIGIDEDLFPTSKHKLCGTDDAMLAHANMNRYILAFKKCFGKAVDPDTFIKLLVTTRKFSKSEILRALWLKYENKELINEAEKNFDEKKK